MRLTSMKPLLLFVILVFVSVGASAIVPNCRQCQGSYNFDTHYFTMECAAVMSGAESCLITISGDTYTCQGQGPHCDTEGDCPEGELCGPDQQGAITPIRSQWEVASVKIHQSRPLNERLASAK